MWKLIKLSKRKKVVGCKWVFSIKYKVNGTIYCYKARLIAKGYTQSYDINYQNTFSSMAKLNPIRVLLSITTNLDWPISLVRCKKFISLWEP